MVNISSYGLFIEKSVCTDMLLKYLKHDVRRCDTLGCSTMLKPCFMAEVEQNEVDMLASNVNIC